MGLDMYLTKKTYVGAEYEHRKVTGEVKILVDGVELPIKFNRISEISERVGYWRKANQIHNWFVQNVQGGEDNCQEYEVSYEQLDKLLQDCKAVLKNPKKAEKILPVLRGCFFGSYEYDEYFLNDLRDTVEIITPLLNEAKEYNGEKYLPETIIYQSSW